MAKLLPVHRLVGDVKRSHKVLVAAVVVGLSLSLTIMAGQAPREYISVEQVRDEPDQFEDRHVEIVAVVVPDSIRQDDDGITHFRIAGESNATLNVTYDKGLTDAFGPDKWVVIEGTVEPGADGPAVRADDVRVGCPSKWDGNKTDAT